MISDGTSGDALEGDSEPLGVGDVRMVRTFRLGADGGLYPVNTAAKWEAGWNTATCNRGRNHAAPDARCGCGFYAYAHPAYALSQAPARQVLAVIATHGTIEIGTKGGRAGQAMIEAVWLGAAVDEELAARLRAQYPTAIVYRDRSAMLADLPLSTLPGYRPPLFSERQRGLFRVGIGSFLGFVAVFGALPTELSLASPGTAAVWLVLLGGALAMCLAGVLVRSSWVIFMGLTAAVWMVSGAGTTTAAGILYRCLLVLTAIWVAMHWVRAARPGLVIRDHPLNTAVRRWRGRLAGSQ